jgi:antitoxin HigA-1
VADRTISFIAAKARISETQLTYSVNLLARSREGLEEEWMEAIHPGEHLAEELREMAMSAAEFSRQISVPTNRVTQILNGRRSITGDTALRLAHFFGTSAEFWLNLQSLYEIRLAVQKSGPAIKALPTIKDFQPARARSAS